MPDLDAAELLKDLKTVSANLKRHIKDEGLRIGAELGKNHAKAADDRIKENTAEMRRLQDLVAELRQQQEPLVQQSDRLREVRNVLVAASRDGAAVIDVKMLLDIADGVPQASGYPAQVN